MDGAGEVQGSLPGPSFCPVCLDTPFPDCLTQRLGPIMQEAEFSLLVEKPRRHSIPWAQGSWEQFGAGTAVCCVFVQCLAQWCPKLLGLQAHVYGSVGGQCSGGQTWWVLDGDVLVCGEHGLDPTPEQFPTAPALGRAGRAREEETLTCAKGVTIMSSPCLYGKNGT